MHCHKGMLASVQCKAPAAGLQDIVSTIKAANAWCGFCGTSVLPEVPNFSRGPNRLRKRRRQECSEAKQTYKIESEDISEGLFPGV